MNNYDKEYLKNKFKDDEKVTEQKKESKKNNKVFKITLAICGALVLGTLAGSIADPEFMSKFSLFKPVEEEREPDINDIYVDNQEENTYYVDFDKYYAIGIKGAIEGKLSDGWYGITTEGIINGVYDGYKNLGFYLSETNHGYYILNNTVENPEFYLILKIKKIDEEHKEKTGIDAIVSAIMLQHKTTKEVVTYSMEKPIKLIVKPGGEVNE